MTASNSVAKKATNNILPTNVLAEAKAIGINNCKRFWSNDHAEFIASYNQTVEQQGLPLDEWRSF